MKAHCLFEQSGTFKNEFKKLGIEAFDYDILNNFGETDFQVDLFEEIRGGYENKPSIFDGINQEDVIVAFFPCVRFENQIMLSFRGQAYGMKNWNDKEKMEYCMKLMSELYENYLLVNKLFLICYERNLKLILENPYSEEHFLRRYWCMQPELIDKDRRINGDYYKKPTQFWFMNCKPTFNVVFENFEQNAIDYHGKDAWKERRKADWEKTGAKSTTEARSMIAPKYAERFIKQFIL